MAGNDQRRSERDQRLPPFLARPEQRLGDDSTDTDSLGYGTPLHSSNVPPSTPGSLVAGLLPVSFSAGADSDPFEQHAPCTYV